MIHLGAFFCYQILATFGVLVVQGAEFPKKAELSYSSWELSRVVQKAGIERMRVKSVTRNSEGTLLFVSGAGGQNESNVVVIVSSGDVQLQNLPGHAILNDQAEVVCRSEDNKLWFSNGQSVELPWNTRFLFTPGGQHFVLFRPKFSAPALFSSAEPKKELFVFDADYFPTAIFDDDEHLYVFGFSGLGGGKTRTGLILTRAEGGVRVEKQLDLSWSGGVVDMDVKSGLLLMENGRDLLPSWILFNIKTGERKKLGIGREHGLFLSPALHEFIKRR
jgi:hypothetical protein